MSRYKIEFIFILILIFLSAVLFFNMQMDKLAYYEMDRNVMYDTIVCGMIGYILIYNHFIFKYKIWLNLLFAGIVVKTAVIISDPLFRITIQEFVKHGNNIKPIGWEFNYKWFELLLVGILLVLLTEMLFWIFNQFNKRYS